MIYSYVFSGNPLKQWSSTNTDGNGLLRVNKNINKLASEVCHKETTFCIWTLPELRRFCKLESVTLYRSLIQHFAFPSPTRNTIKINKATIGKLKLFRNLKTLTFEASFWNQRYGDRIFDNLAKGDATVAENNGHKALHLLSAELPHLKVFLHRTHKERLERSLNPRQFSSRGMLFPHGIRKDELMKVTDKEYDRTWRVVRDQEGSNGPRYRLELDEMRVWMTKEAETWVTIAFVHKPLLNPEHQRLANEERAREPQWEAEKKAKAEAEEKLKVKVEVKSEPEEG